MANKVISKGDTVRLKKGVTFTIPEGREDNKTAKVLSLLSDVEGGLFLDRDLRGIRYWNVNDVAVVKRNN